MFSENEHEPGAIVDVVFSKVDEGEYGIVLNSMSPPPPPPIRKKEGLSRQACLY